VTLPESILRKCQQISETEASDSQIHSHNLGKKKNFLSGDSEVVPKLDFSVSSGP